MTVQTQQLTRTNHYRSVKKDLAPTPHPAWVTSMIDNLAPQWAEVADAPLFQETIHGEFPVRAWRQVVRQFFGVVEAFPKYMGSYLGRTTFGQTPGDLLARNWLIGNIRVEALHAQWFIDWGIALGLTYDEIVTARPGPEVAALQEYLWSVSQRGSLAEAFAAVNYAVEGTTGEWTHQVIPAFSQHFDGDKAALKWLSAHADYDDAHPREALELVKLTAHDAATQRKVEEATRLSLQLLRRGLDACFHETAG